MDLEVDGERYHRTGSVARKDDYYRDLQMESLGWKVLRFWVYELREDLDGCVNKVLELMKENEQ